MLGLYIHLYRERYRLYVCVYLEFGGGGGGRRLGIWLVAFYASFLFCFFFVLFFLGGGGGGDMVQTLVVIDICVLGKIFCDHHLEFHCILA